MMKFTHIVILFYIYLDLCMEISVETFVQIYISYMNLSK